MNPSERDLSPDYVEGVVYGLKLAMELASSVMAYAAVAKISQALAFVRRTATVPSGPSALSPGAPAQDDGERP